MTSDYSIVQLFYQFFEISLNPLTNPRFTQKLGYIVSAAAKRGGMDPPLWHNISPRQYLCIQQ